MKFTLALLAIGAQAVKLHQEEVEDPDFIADRVEALFRIVDWNGSGDVDADELKDFAYIAEAWGYIDEEEADGAYEGADELVDAFGGPFSFEDLEGAVMASIAEDDYTLVDTVVEVLE